MQDQVREAGGRHGASDGPVEETDCLGGGRETDLQSRLPAVRRGVAAFDNQAWLVLSSSLIPMAYLSFSLTR